MNLALIVFSGPLKVGLTKRSGVAGLISVIAIVLVFGLAATAFLTITSQQTSLANTFSKTSNIQNSRISEKLDVEVVGCQWVDPNKELAEVKVNATNNWSESSFVDAILFTNSTYVFDSQYIPDVDKKIPSLQSDKQITVNAKINQTNNFADRVQVVTELGNKFVDAHTFNDINCGG